MPRDYFEIRGVAPATEGEGLRFHNLLPANGGQGVRLAPFKLGSPTFDPD
jgi:hypothetical protein